MGDQNEGVVRISLLWDWEREVSQGFQEALYLQGQLGWLPILGKVKALRRKAVGFVSYLPTIFANLDCQRQLVHSPALDANIFLYDWKFSWWLRSVAGSDPKLLGICQDLKQAIIYLQRNNLAQKLGTEGWKKEGESSSQLTGSNKYNNSTVEGC